MYNRARLFRGAYVCLQRERCVIVSRQRHRRRDDPFGLATSADDEDNDE